MAQLVAVSQLDIFQADLFYYSQYYYDDNLQKNVNITFNGVVYPDYYWVNAYDGYDDLNLEFLGSNITANAEGEITGGTVNVIAEIDVASSQALWVAWGFSVSAVALYNAAFTPSNADEQALFISALSGNDAIVMSPFSDRVSGFDGDDRITGAGGNDILEGGSGFDTAVYVGPIENYSISFQGQTLVVSSAAEGVDQLTGFEQLEFNGVVRSLASLNDLIRPTLTASSPADGSVDIDSSSDIELSFSEAIFAETGMIYLREGGETGAVIEAFSVETSDALAFSGSTLSIDPTQALDGGTRYFVTFDEGAIVDAAGNTFEPVVVDFTTETIVPEDPTFRLISTTGQDAGVGGSGAVFGTNGFQDIEILDVPGLITFDPSFNAGKDIIHLNGDAGDWSIKAVGSSAVLSDGDTTVEIPLGTAPTPIVFDDGVRALMIDTVSHAARVGGQIITASEVIVTAQSDATPLPTGMLEDAGGNLLLSDGIDVYAEGVVSIFGTSGVEMIHLLEGTFALDPSFNKGGDTIILPGEAQTYSAHLVGSSVELEGGEFSLTIPVGPSGLNLQFADGDTRMVKFDTVEHSVLIANQEILIDPSALSVIA